jgi:hypothetical protein
VGFDLMTAPRRESKVDVVMLALVEGSASEARIENNDWRSFTETPQMEMVSVDIYQTPGRGSGRHIPAVLDVFVRGTQTEDNDAGQGRRRCEPPNPSTHVASGKEPLDTTGSKKFQGGLPEVTRRATRQRKK